MTPIIDKKEQIPDELFMKAMELYDNGKSIPEILALFPEYKDGLSRMFNLAAVLKSKKGDIYPSKESLAKVISGVPFESLSAEKQDPVEKIAGGVTGLESDRYSRGGSFIKGRTSFSQSFKINLLNLFNMNQKIYAGVAVLLLVLGAGLIYQQSRRGADDVASSIERQASQDEETFDKELADLESMDKDASLNDLDGDLADISGESESSGGGVELALIENMDADFATDMGNFTKELSEFDSLNSDTALDNLDSGLSTIIQ